MNEQNMSQNGWIESPEHNADGNSLTALDAKITDMFPGVTVRKDLVGSARKVAHFGSWPSMER